MYVCVYGCNRAQESTTLTACLLLRAVSSMSESLHGPRQCQRQPHVPARMSC